MPDVYEPDWLHRLVRRALPDDGVTSWVPGGDFATSSLVRVPRYPNEIDDETDTALSVEAVRNERQSGQIAVIADEPLSDLSVTIENLRSNAGETLSSERVQARFVEYVPVVKSSAEHRWASRVEEVIGDAVSGARAPDVVGDPLLDAESIDVPALKAQPIWFTIDVPEGTKEGTYSGEIRIETADRDPITYDLSVSVRDVTLADPVDWTFHLDLWINPNAIATEHDVEDWSEDHWDLLENYLEHLADLGQSLVLTTIIEEPWQQTKTYYDSMVTWHHDAEDGWSFDYEIFDRFVETALEAGVGPEIAAYSILTFSPPERVTYYEDGERVVEELDAGGDRWVEIWTAFFDDFVAHLKERDWLDQTLIAVDERDEEPLEAATDLLEDVAPGLADRLQIAGTLEGEPFAYDFSSNTSELPLDPSLLEERRRAGKRTTFYTGGRPAHPNTFSFSPAVESRMLPWIAADQQLDGFLKWALNNWPHDPRENPVKGYPQGGEYLIYPGDDGPASSIRVELVRDGIEDYELVSMLREGDPDAPALEPALAMATREYDGREKDPADVPSARRAIVEALAER